MVRSELGRRVLSVVACFLVLQGTGLRPLSVWAGAAEPPRVLVLPVAPADSGVEVAAGRLSSALGQELARRGALKPAGPPSTGAGSLTGKALEAQRAFDEAKRLLGALRFDAAAATLEKGLDAALVDPAQLDFAQLLEAYVSLGVAQLRLGNDEKAQAALLEVARLSPTYQLPEGRYPPVFVRELEKAKKRAERLPRAVLDVEGPPGANAYVDGRNLGMVPVREENLAQGTHFVMLDGTRKERFGQAVDVRASAANKVTGRFSGTASGSEEEPPLTALGPKLDVQAPARLAQWAQARQAQAVLVTTLAAQGDGQLSLGAALYVVRRGGLVVLPRLSWTAEAEGRGPQVARLFDAVERELSQGTGVLTTLPLELGPPPALALAQEGAAEEGEPVERASPRPLLRPEVAPSTGATRAFQAPSRVVGDDPEYVSTARTADKDGVAWWVWALGGVGVAAVAAGTWYGVSQATKPVTGTVSASW